MQLARPQPVIIASICLLCGVFVFIERFSAPVGPVASMAGRVALVLAVLAPVALAAAAMAAGASGASGGGVWLAGGHVWCSASSNSSGPVLLLPGDGSVVAEARVVYGSRGGVLYAYADIPLARFGCGPVGEPRLAEEVRDAVRGELGFIERVYGSLRGGGRLDAGLVGSQRLEATVPGWLRGLDSRLWRGLLAGFTGRAAAVIEAVERGGFRPAASLELADLADAVDNLRVAVSSGPPGGGAPQLRRVRLEGASWPVPGASLGGYDLPGAPGWPLGALLARVSDQPDAVAALGLLGSGEAYSRELLYDPALGSFLYYEVSAGLLDFDGDGSREPVYVLGRMDFCRGFFGGFDHEDVLVYAGEGRIHGFFSLASPGSLGGVEKSLRGRLLGAVPEPGPLAGKPPLYYVPVSRGAVFAAYRSGGSVGLYYIEHGRAYLVSAHGSGSGPFLAAFQDRGGRYYLVDLGGWRLVVYDPAKHRLVAEEKLPGGPPRGLGGLRYRLFHAAVYPVDLDRDGGREAVLVVAARGRRTGYLPVLTMVFSDSSAPAPLDRDGDGYVDAVAYPDGRVEKLPAPPASCGPSQARYIGGLVEALHYAARVAAALAAEKGRLDVLRAMAARANLTLLSPAGRVYYTLLTGGGAAYPGREAAKDYTRALVGAVYAAALLEAAGLESSLLPLPPGAPGEAAALLLYDAGSGAASARRLLEEALPAIRGPAGWLASGLYGDAGLQELEDAAIYLKRLAGRAAGAAGSTAASSGAPTSTAGAAGGAAAGAGGSASAPTSTSAAATPPASASKPGAGSSTVPAPEAPGATGGPGGGSLLAAVAVGLAALAVAVLAARRRGA